MRGKRRHFGLFAVLVVAMIVAGSAAAGAHYGWDGWATTATTTHIRSRS
jgi:uncharacterized membrane protein YedE/YeeE